MVLTALDVGGQIVLWENAHWTAAGGLAARYAALIARKATGHRPPDRDPGGAGTLAWFLGQLAWNVQTALGYFNVPAPSDVGFLLLVPPIVAAFVVAVYGRLPRPRRPPSISTRWPSSWPSPRSSSPYGDGSAAAKPSGVPSRSPIRSCTSPPQRGPGRPARGPRRAARRRLHPAARARRGRLRLGRLAASGGRRAAGRRQPRQLCVLVRDGRDRRRGRAAGASARAAATVPRVSPWSSAACRSSPSSRAP